MNNKRVLITGASRGLGLSFAEKFVQKGWTVFAAARAPEKSSGLMTLREQHPKKLFPVCLDVSNETSVKKAYAEISNQTKQLDILINNAGIYGSRGGGDLNALDLTDIENTFRTNILGPLMVTRTFLPLLKNGADKKLVQITSLMGSIEDNGSGGSYGYRMSKAALNMLNKNFSIDLAGDGITSVTLHPGWVQTDMGGSGAPLDIDTSVDGMVNVILSLSNKQNGSFLRYDGTPAPY